MDPHGIGRRGPSRRAAILPNPRNDEGRLGFPRAAFRTLSASEDPPRAGVRCPRNDDPRSLVARADTSKPEANGGVSPWPLRAARLRAWFAGSGTPWGLLSDGGGRRSQLSTVWPAVRQETKRTLFPNSIGRLQRLRGVTARRRPTPASPRNRSAIAADRSPRGAPARPRALSAQVRGSRRPSRRGPNWLARSGEGAR